MSLKIALVASEMAPMVKVGGLGDVVASLAGALRELGASVTVFIPYYGNFDLAAYSFARRLIPVRVRIAGRDADLEIYEGKIASGVEVRALRCPEYFERQKAYTDEADEPQRFGLFSKAVSIIIGQESERYDILHCHDWHTSLVPFFLKKRSVGGQEAGRIPVVLTIHNMAHQGLSDKTIIGDLDLGWENFNPSALEFYGKVNFLKAGLISADAVTTVSPNYAKEVFDPACGAGLEGVLESLTVPFRGILNGIDASTWDPSRDKSIEAPYSGKNLSGKQECRTALQKEMYLHADPSVSIIGIVARLTHQKGIDLVMAVLPRLLRSNIQLAILGEGQKSMEERLLQAMQTWKGRVGVKIMFDEPLSHRIYAGSDVFLVPSRFEPCGLSAMIAMRYGSVPVARATGGLVDTVVDVDRFMKTGSGFVFNQVDGVELLGAALRAVSFHQAGDGKDWSKFVGRIMSRDYSWAVSAKKYEALYKEIRM
ncbi:MAG: glycogen synthase GlgA [Pseudomonadota bacterium]